MNGGRECLFVTTLAYAMEGLSYTALQRGQELEQRPFAFLQRRKKMYASIHTLHNLHTSWYILERSNFNDILIKPWLLTYVLGGKQ